MLILSVATFCVFLLHLLLIWLNILPKRCIIDQNVRKNVIIKKRKKKKKKGETFVSKWPTSYWIYGRNVRKKLKEIIFIKK